MAFSSCTVPARGIPTFKMGADEMEVGIGIHGEPGRKRKPLETVDAITDLLTLSIIEDSAYIRTVREWDETNGTWVDVEIINQPLKSGDRVLAFVNSMGGTPLSELYIVYRGLAEICERRGLKIVRNLIGSYITSLEMQGCSITLLRMNDELIRLWDAPVNTPALRWGV